MPAAASRRQMRRARDREIQRCRDDMLSDDKQLNALAKRRLEEVDRAFVYLTEPAKFRDFLELVNDRLRLGTIEPNSFMATISTEENAAAQGSNIASGTAASDAGSDLSSNGDAERIAMSMAEEHEVLRELRKKRLEKAPKIGRKRRLDSEKKAKEALTAIAQTANTSAHSKARELIEHRVTDADEFYERVFACALKEASWVRDKALDEMRTADLLIDEKLLDDLEVAVADQAEAAAEKEYNELEGIVAAVQKSRRNKFFPALLTMCLIAGLLVMLCNMDIFVSTTKQDPVVRQIESASGTVDGANSSALKGADAIDLNAVRVSEVPAIASARSLVAPAGAAGMAGRATTLSMDGSADFNAGSDAIARGDSANGLAHLTAAVQKNSDLYQYPYSRGCTYLWLNRLPEALADFNSTLSLRSDLMQARYNKGLIYLQYSAAQIDRAYATADGAEQTKLLTQAAASLRAAVIEFSAVQEKMPALPQPYYNRALARFRLGDLKGAAADFEAAKSRDASPAAADANLKVVRALLENPKAQPPSIDTKQAPPVGPEGPPGPGYF